MRDVGTDIIWSVSDFVASLNQTLDYAYPSVTIQGELANFRISKNRWVYFDLKDETSSVKCFGTVYQLTGPLEDGMLLKVRGVPRLHQQFGFSLNIMSLQPAGEGSIKKAAALLEAKLKAEGLFAPERKRLLPQIPQRIGLIASGESAAYHDFIKIVNARWGGLNIELADVQVQGEAAVPQIEAALNYFNSQAESVDVIVVTRGGGGAEDLAAFSTEQVTRAVAGSRIPTLVAIGHEVDISLAELAADQRASTPSNAAELLVPDKKQELARLKSYPSDMLRALTGSVSVVRQQLERHIQDLEQSIIRKLQHEQQHIENITGLLAALSPTAALARGYAILRSDVGGPLTSATQLKKDQAITLELRDGSAEATIKRVIL